MIEGKFFMYKDETPLWSRCDRCNRLNIISNIRKCTCNNCKKALNSYMRELATLEIDKYVKWIK